MLIVTRLSLIALIAAALGLSACGRRPDSLSAPGTAETEAAGEQSETAAPAEPPIYPRTYPTY